MSSRWPSYKELEEQVTLLNLALVNGRIQKVRDPDRSSVALKVRFPGRTFFLTLSGDPDRGRIELSLKQPPTLPQPTGIGRWVRAHIAGGRILAIELHPEDRVVTLKTARGSLCLELLPQAPNLYTLSEDGRVMGWTKRIPSRGLKLGQKWTAPERPQGLALETMSNIDERLSGLSQEEALKIISERLGTPHEEMVNPVDDTERELRHCKRLIKQTRDRLKRLCDGLWSDLERAERAEMWREEGELLKSHLNQLKRGLTQVSVTDWYDPDMGQRVIELDPKLDGLENIERRFQRHRKALKGATIATERLSVADHQLETLEEISSRLSEGPLEELKSELAEAGIYRAKQKQRRPQQQEKRLPYRVFWSATGEVIWLGRGGNDNHLTTFQSARGQDLWVHTRDVPGAHVIIPLAHRGHTPHRETILDAAALSVHHSKQRDEEGVALYFTERKHLRPVPGGPPGKVMVSSSKTVIADQVSERVTRLYEEAQRRTATSS